MTSQIRLVSGIGASDCYRSRFCPREGNPCLASLEEADLGLIWGDKKTGALDKVDLILPEEKLGTLGETLYRRPSLAGSDRGLSTIHATETSRACDGHAKEIVGRTLDTPLRQIVPRLMVYMRVLQHRLRRDASGVQGSPAG